MAQHPTRELAIRHAGVGDLKVFIAARESSCDECQEDLGAHAWIVLAGERGALCLACAGLDHLVYLPSGDQALTRRARTHSVLSAVVLKWSRARKRYERQGLLVEEAALAQAEEECLADGEARKRARLRATERRAEADHEHIQRFAARVREVFPHCPLGAEHLVAEHACLKYSGRVGRSASAKAFEDAAVKAAVTAHVRHVHTRYDRLLAQGHDRHEARALVAPEVAALLEAWERPCMA